MAYDSKKHHYVSQLYLKHFTFDPQEKRVYPMTKIGKKHAKSRGLLIRS